MMRGHPVRASKSKHRHHGGVVRYSPSDVVDQQDLTHVYADLKKTWCLGERVELRQHRETERETGRVRARDGRWLDNVMVLATEALKAVCNVQYDTTANLLWTAGCSIRNNNITSAQLLRLRSLQHAELDAYTQRTTGRL